jgi:homoserine dehydrogenase
MNGTSNFILTKMTDDRKDFKVVLKEAQDLGFAEADPSFDIEGIDTAHKLAIVLTLSYGKEYPWMSFTGRAFQISVSRMWNSPANWDIASNCLP